MTREEAAERIETIKMTLEECIEGEDDVSYITSDDVNALDMAIKALEQEPCKDAISRKAVLDTLDKMDSVLDEDRTVETYKELLTACYNDLPSVTPTTCIAKVTFCKDDLQELVDEKVEGLAQHMERRWIPVSERLPSVKNYQRKYLVTLKDKTVCDAMFTECDGEHWWNYNYDDVIAWMPLPEPYKEESEEK